MAMSPRRSLYSSQISSSTSGALGEGMTAVVSAIVERPEQRLEDVVVVESFRGEKAKNSRPSPTSAEDADGSCDPLMTEELCSVSSGVDSFGKFGLIVVVFWFG